MDPCNRYHTDESWRLERLEHTGLMLLAIGLALANLDGIRWALFVLAFVVIDAVGYVPGAIAYRRAGGGPISPVYHHLYNLTHSYLSAALAIGLWALAIGGVEPAMLAIPIHLAGDRGLFGNTFKPLALPFEPVPVPPEGVLSSPHAEASASPVAPTAEVSPELQEVL